MEKLFEIATNIKTPLALGGLVAVIFFLIVKRIVEKLSKMPGREHGCRGLMAPGTKSNERVGCHDGIDLFPQTRFGSVRFGKFPVSG